jgi:hypothetical protein
MAEETKAAPKTAKRATAAEKAADPKYHSVNANTNPKGDD